MQDKNSWFEWIKILVIALVVAYVVRTFLISPIVVDGESMLPTLHDRDQMIVNKISYRFQEPKRFDVVIFHAPTQKNFIKRVIGLPGEHVMVKEDILYINGEEVEEPYLKEVKENQRSNEFLTRDFNLESLPGNYEEIPADYVLVLGDNRRNSTDSRTIGLIPIDEIIGKTNFIYFPFKRIQLLKE